MSTPKERLKSLRQALGISPSEMSAALGLDDERGGDSIREMERGGRDISGPILRLMRYMEQAVEADADPVIADLTFKVLPRWLDCFDLEDFDGEGRVEIVFHTRWPRFFAFVVDDLEDVEGLKVADIPVLKLPDEVGLGWMVALFLDPPVRDPMPLVEEAARLKVGQALQDIQG